MWKDAYFKILIVAIEGNYILYISYWFLRKKIDKLFSLRMEHFWEHAWINLNNSFFPVFLSNFADFFLALIIFYQHIVILVFLQFIDQDISPQQMLEVILLPLLILICKISIIFSFLSNRWKNSTQINCIARKSYQFYFKLMNRIKEECAIYKVNYHTVGWRRWEERDRKSVV